MAKIEMFVPQYEEPGNTRSPIRHYESRAGCEINGTYYEVAHAVSAEAYRHGRQNGWSDYVRGALMRRLGNVIMENLFKGVE